MSLNNCNPYVTCDNANGAKSDSQLFRELLTENGNDCPELRVAGRVSGSDDDGQEITNNAPALIGAKAVDVDTYAPSYESGEAVMLVANKETGALLVQQGDLDRATDSVTSYRASSVTATYSAAISRLALEGTPSEFFHIYGSASKVIRIKRVTISGVASTAIVAPLIIVKRSSAATGGSTSALTAVSYDSNDGAATAIVTAYTADGTPGSSLGAIRSISVPLPLASAANNNVVVIEFGKEGEKELILRGTAQGLGLSFGGTTISSGLADISVTWTEE